MKNLVFFLCLLPSFCFAGDAEEILSILQANFDAANKEDVEAMLATCSVDMPDRNKLKDECVRVWAEKDIHYSIMDFKLIESDDRFAIAQVTQKTHSTDRKHATEDERFFRNGTGLLPDAEVVEYFAAFKKDSGKWKCYLTITEPVAVAPQK